MKTLTNNVFRSSWLVKKRVLGCAICILWGAVSFSQKPVEVTYTANSNNGVYTFQGKNPNFCDYTVKVDVSRLEGGTCDAPLPFIGAVPSGSSTLFSLKPTQDGQPVSFGYGYVAIKGKILKKAPEAFVYLFPFSNKAPHRALATQNIVEVVLGKKVSNFYGLSFVMNQGDSVFAARRGVVSEVKNTVDKQSDKVWFSSETNFVEIFQQDGTFMRYNRLKKGEIAVKEGDDVEAGQLLGIVADGAFEGSTVVQITNYYLDKANAFVENKYPFAYLAPVFYNSNTPNGAQVQSGETYQAQWPENIITQEMPKRVLKKWKSSQTKPN